MRSYDVMFPFEFCALRFLLQWQSNEQELHRDIKSDPREDTIRKALRYFQVARNFKGLNEPGKATIIQRALLKVRADQSLSTHLKVESLARDLQSDFGKFNLSAASKLLWLSQREPFIIYDKRAVDALTRNCRRFDVRDYSEYCKIWREQYLKFETAIRSAVQQLPKGRIFMPRLPLSDHELLLMVNEAWFMERVFDIYLWEVGGVEGGEKGKSWLRP